MCKNFTRRPCASTCGRTCSGYRDRAGLSQRQVAGELGLSRSAYTYYETGKTTPSAVDLFTLAQLYRVPVEEFFRP